MRMARLLTVPFLLLGACGPWPWVVAGEPSEPVRVELTPLALGQRELDFWRDDTHKREMKIVWPEMTALPAQVPENAEAYLIKGYIDYTCTRLRWEKGAVRAERIMMKRTWFCNSQGESFAGERLSVVPGDFTRAWLAAKLLLGARDERLKPEPMQPMEQDADGSWHGSSSGSCSISKGSHEPHLFIRLTQPDARIYQSAIRGESRTNGIQNFQELQNRAIFSVFDSLCPAGRNAPQGPEFPVTEWCEFLTAELKQAGQGTVVDKVADDCRLLLETTLRALGHAGYAAAEADIAGLHKKLEAADRDKNYTAFCIRDETEIALTKIEMLNRWNAERAATLIHGNLRKMHWQNDLAKWVRGLYFQRDQPGYHQLLLADLKPDSKPALLCETLAELQMRFHGQDLERIGVLVSHADPEVAVEGCFILIDPKLNPEPNTQPALAALDRLAGDPDTPISPYSKWFEHFARSRALKYLASVQAPEAVRWTAVRVRWQLDKVEDGRMVHELLTTLNCLHDPASEADKAAAYRRALSRPYSWGTLTACEELAKLKDAQSATTVRKILSELERDCNKHLSWQEDSTAKYPWVDKYELEDTAKLWKTK